MIPYQKLQMSGTCASAQLKKYGWVLGIFKGLTVTLSRVSLKDEKCRVSQWANRLRTDHISPIFRIYPLACVLLYNRYRVPGFSSRAMSYSPTMPIRQGINQGRRGKKKKEKGSIKNTKIRPIPPLYNEHTDAMLGQTRKEKGVSVYI